MGSEKRRSFNFGELIHDKLTIGSINMLYLYIIIIPVSKKLSGKVFNMNEKFYSINKKKSKAYLLKITS